MSKFKVNVLATSIFLAISSYASAASLGNVGDTLGPSGNTIGNAGSASVAIGQYSSATGAGGVAIGKGTEANNDFKLLSVRTLAWRSAHVPKLQLQVVSP